MYSTASSSFQSGSGLPTSSRFGSGGGSATYMHPSLSSQRVSASTSTTTATTAASSTSSSSSSSFFGARKISLIPSTFSISSDDQSVRGNLGPSSTSQSGLGSASPATNNAAVKVPDILDRPRDKTRSNEVSLSSLQFLYAEMISYSQNRVNGITDLERRLSLFGYQIGSRILHLSIHRQETSLNPKNPKREIKLLPTLLWIHTTFWKNAFGKPADSLERSTESGRGDEYMISTNAPAFSRTISVPKEMSQLSVEAITAGMVEAALDGLGFPARVTAHNVPTPQFPNRTTILIKLDKSVMQREEALS